MVRAAIIYITAFIFMVGLVILVCGTQITPPSVGLMVIGGYLVISAIVCAALVTIVEPKIRPKPPTEEQEPLTPAKKEEDQILC